MTTHDTYPPPVDLVRWLRRTANPARDTDPIRRDRDAVLHYRAAAVRPDLLEIAAALERAQSPDPACIATLHNLLSNGCDSPLYDSRIPMSELHSTLDDVRSQLIGR